MEFVPPCLAHPTTMDRGGLFKGKSQTGPWFRGPKICLTARRAEGLLLARLLEVSAELGGRGGALGVRPGAGGGAGARPHGGQAGVSGPSWETVLQSPWMGMVVGSLGARRPAGGWLSLQAPPAQGTWLHARCPRAIFFPTRLTGQGRSRGVQGLRTVADPDTSSEPRGASDRLSRISGN